ncbi:hypothetical protein AB6A40_009324 [Gnathostoma spinigerum]|uniref:Uncharacterized protein n=1 Tax=Gnathostoma spinigerum TaxID=75299 RepID=A0ABD6ESW0_9BILA
MLKRFKNDHPFSLDVSQSAPNLIAVGFVSGNVGMFNFNFSRKQLSVLDVRRMRASIRSCRFSMDGKTLYAVSENKGLSIYDTTNYKRTRCFVKCHDQKPSSMCILPSCSTKGQQVATADEDGEVRTWDFRIGEPLICKFKDLEDVVNELFMAQNTLLAVCADGTLGAYDVRKRKLLMRSEPMHSDLLSVTVTGKIFGNRSLVLQRRT